MRTRFALPVVACLFFVACQPPTVENETPVFEDANFAVQAPQSLEERNIELVKANFKRIAAGDLQGFTDAMEPNVTWRVFGDRLPWAADGTMHGREGVKEFFYKLSPYFGIVSITPYAFTAQGNTVVTQTKEVVVNKVSGATYELDMSKIVTLTADGQWQDMKIYYDTGVLEKMMVDAGQIAPNGTCSSTGE